MQCMMIRILFVWAIRHPASAYVQGINDLCAPLLLVFLSEYIMKAEQEEQALIKASKNRRNIKITAKDDIKEEEKDPFSNSPIVELMKTKKRSSIYDVKEEDFNRLVTLNKSSKEKSQEQELGELEEYFEEIGDIDPK